MINIGDGVLGSSYSYYERYKRSKGVTDEMIKSERLLTDRGAYLSFLEVQLERVSAACLASEAVDGRMDQLQKQMIAIEEKISGLTRLTKLTQTYAEEQGTDLGRSLAALTSRVGALEARMDKLPTVFQELTQELETTKSITRGLAKQASASQEKHAATASRLELLENQVLQLNKGLHDVGQALPRSETKLVGNFQSLWDERTAQLQSALDVLAQQFQHEMAASENKMLAAISKQATAGQQQLVRVQSVVQEALAQGELGPAARTGSAAVAALSNEVQQLFEKQSKRIDQCQEDIQTTRQIAMDAASTAAESSRSDETQISIIQESMKGFAEQSQIQLLQAAIKELAGNSVTFAQEQQQLVEEGLKMAEDHINSVKLELQDQAKTTGENLEKVNLKLQDQTKTTVENFEKVKLKLQDQAKTIGENLEKIRSEMIGEIRDAHADIRVDVDEIQNILNTKFEGRFQRIESDQYLLKHVQDEMKLTEKQILEKLQKMASARSPGKQIQSKSGNDALASRLQSTLLTQMRSAVSLVGTRLDKHLAKAMKKLSEKQAKLTEQLKDLDQRFNSFLALYRKNQDKATKQNVKTEKQRLQCKDDLDHFQEEDLQSMAGNSLFRDWNGATEVQPHTIRRNQNNSTLKEPGPQNLLSSRKDASGVYSNASRPDLERPRSPSPITHPSKLGTRTPGSASKPNLSWRDNKTKLNLRNSPPQATGNHQSEDDELLTVMSDLQSIGQDVQKNSLFQDISSIFGASDHQRFHQKTPSKVLKKKDRKKRGAMLSSRGTPQKRNAFVWESTVFDSPTAVSANEFSKSASPTQKKKPWIPPADLSSKHGERRRLPIRRSFSLPRLETLLEKKEDDSSSSVTASRSDLSSSFNLNRTYIS